LRVRQKSTTPVQLHTPYVADPKAVPVAVKQTTKKTKPKAKRNKTKSLSF
jgi:hypothetical protein